MILNTFYSMTFCLKPSRFTRPTKNDRSRDEKCHFLSFFHRKWSSLILGLTWVPIVKWPTDSEYAVGFWNKVQNKKLLAKNLWRLTWITIFRNEIYFLGWKMTQKHSAMVSVFFPLRGNKKPYLYAFDLAFKMWKQKS